MHSLIHRSSISSFALLLLVAFLALPFAGCDDDADDDDLNDTTIDTRVNDTLNVEAEVSPAEERRETLSELDRMRTRLTAELDRVRAELNEGSLTPDERDKQTSRAAELAQGLERLDRAILEVNEANDDTWISLRTNSRQGVEDLHAWMRQNEVAD